MFLCICLLCHSCISCQLFYKLGFPTIQTTRLLMQTINTAVSLQTLLDGVEGCKTKRDRSQKAGITIEIRFLMRIAFVPVRRYMSNCPLKAEFPLAVKEQLFCALTELECEGKKLVRSFHPSKSGRIKI